MQQQQLLTLFDEYSGMVYRIAMSYLHQPQDAEDATQAIFLKLIEGKARPLPGKERAFLTQIAVNHCKDMLRAAWRKRNIPLEDVYAFAQPQDRDLLHAVGALAPKHRIVIYLHYYEGYTFSEIATFLNISPSAVSMRVHRARKQLKHTLREDEHEAHLQL